MPPQGPNSPSRDTNRTPVESEQSTNAKTSSPVMLGSTPARRSTHRGGDKVFADGSSRDELIQKWMEFQEKFDGLQPVNSKLLKEVKKKKESYVRREVFYKSQISHIKDVLEKTVLCRGGKESSMPAIRNMHQQVMANIEEMKSRRDRTMEEHEKNLLRQFRSNIIEVEDRFKKEQSKEDDVAGVPRAWIERTAQLSRDVDKHKEQAIRLDRINDVLNQKVEKYKHECKIQEDDREFLVRQLVAIKKENSRLRREIEKFASGVKLETMKLVPPQSGSGRVGQLRSAVGTSRPTTISSTGTPKTESRTAELQKYNEVHERLKKLLDKERRHAREAKAAHMKLLTNRTQLEGMLRDCVDEMKEEAGIRAEEGGTGHGLSKEDRERVLELLLSQEKAIALLYGESFRTSAPSVTTMALNEGTGADAVKAKGDDVDLSIYADDLAAVDEDIDEDP